MLNPDHPLWNDKRIFPDLPLPARIHTRPEEAKAQVREGRTWKMITMPGLVRSPLVVSYGMGTDSTALLVLLVAMVHRGNADARPDIVQFADVGSEKPNTYAYVAVMDAFMELHGFPKTTVLSKTDRGTSKHESLHEQCLTLETMPSLAFGGKSCSLKWKAAEMDYSMNRQHCAQAAWACEKPVVKLIGYDASPADMRRSQNPGDEKFSYAYPLRSAGLVRDRLKEIISAAGLPQPGKSACFMCPASKRPEVIELAEKHPKLAGLALRIEAQSIFRTLKEGRPYSTVGLGRNWNWREYLSAARPELLAKLERSEDCGTAEWLGCQALLDQARSQCEPTVPLLSTEFTPAIEDEGDCGAEAATATTTEEA
jgi:hypothetical protein